MGKEHYFICRDNPFLLLGRDKWLTCQELLEGRHAIYSFPNGKQAQGVQAILPKAMKPGTKIRSSKSLEQTYALKFIPGRGFVRSEAVERGPKFEAPFRNESLIIFVLPGSRGSSVQEDSDTETSEEGKKTMPETQVPETAIEKAASRNPGTGRAPPR